MPKPERFEKLAPPSTFWVGKTETGKPIIYGYGIVSKVRDASGAWVDYYDLQGDHVPEDVCEKSGAAFMRLGGAGKVMHIGPSVAKCVFAFPMTTAIIEKLEPAAAAHFTRSGLVIGFECDEALADKARKGEFTGFSLGGWVTDSKLLDKGASKGRARARKDAGPVGTPPRRIILALDLDEFSIVDFPAQEPATIALVKARQRIVKAWVDDSTVPNMMTTSVDGHVHMVCCGPMHTSGETTYNSGKENEGHSHPWQRDPATGAITLGESFGHTHELEPMPPVAVLVEVMLTPEQFADAVTAAASDENSDEYATRGARTESANLDNARGNGHNDRSKGDTTMPTDAEKIAELNKALAEAATRAAAQQSLIDKAVTMTVEEFTHLASLPAAERPAFIALDKGARTVAIKAAADANPVVHTDKRGHVWRKSDDVRAVDAAKAADSQGEKLAAAEATANRERLEKRALAELPSVPGTLAVKAAVLAAVEGIADEPTRKAAGEMLVALETAAKDALTRKGVGGGNADGSAQVKYDAALKAFADARKETIFAAAEAFHDTAEGKALIKAIGDEKRAQRPGQAAGG